MRYFPTFRDNWLYAQSDCNRQNAAAEHPHAPDADRSASLRYAARSGVKRNDRRYCPASTVVTRRAPGRSGCGNPRRRVGVARHELQHQDADAAPPAGQSRSWCWPRRPSHIRPPSRASGPVPASSSTLTPSPNPVPPLVVVEIRPAAGG